MCGPCPLSPLQFSIRLSEFYRLEFISVWSRLNFTIIADAETIFILKKSQQPPNQIKPILIEVVKWILFSQMTTLKMKL